MSKVLSDEQLKEAFKRIITNSVKDMASSYNNGESGYDWLPTIRAITEIAIEQKIAWASEVIGSESGSDMNDDELVHSLQKMYQWGIGTGRRLEAGKIKQVDDRDWEMVATKLDQFEQTFTNRAIRKARNRNQLNKTERE